MIVHVYPVGVLSDLRHAWRYLTTRTFPDGTQPSWPWRLRRVRIEIRQARRRVTWDVRRRNWRGFKNTFNGYMAEPLEFPPGDYRRCCGTGWTKARALRSLHRRLPADSYRDMSTWEVRP